MLQHTLVREHFLFRSLSSFLRNLLACFDISKMQAAHSFGWCNKKMCHKHFPQRGRALHPNMSLHRAAMRIITGQCLLRFPLEMVVHQHSCTQTGHYGRWFSPKVPLNNYRNSLDHLAKIASLDQHPGTRYLIHRVCRACRAKSGMMDRQFVARGSRSRLHGLWEWMQFSCSWF